MARSSRGPGQRTQDKQRRIQALKMQQSIDEDSGRRVGLNQRRLNIRLAAYAATIKRGSHDGMTVDTRSFHKPNTGKRAK